MKWPIDNTVAVVGATRSFEGKAAFARADAVFSRGLEEKLHVQSYPDEATVEGKPVSPDEWKMLIDTAQALEFRPTLTPAKLHGLVVWILRSPMGEWRSKAVAELRRGDALAAEPVQGPDGATACLVVEPSAKVVRRRLRTQVFDTAWSAAREGRWPEAETHAELAFLLDERLSVSGVALVSLCAEERGNKTWADDYLAMARNSRGELFYNEIQAQKQQYLRELEQRFPHRMDARTPSHPRRPRHWDLIQRGSNAALHGTPFCVKVTRIEKLTIHRLEYVFSPWGLPLVEKTPGVPPSTSILVRGPAGTGKTTLAVAFGHAIARENKGVALYLSTEIALADLVYKVEQLHLEGSPAVDWERRGEARVGSLVAQHLALTGVDEEVDTPDDQQRAAIDAVVELLENYGSPPLPVRAVVIDAFGLRDAHTEERSMRTDLRRLVQMLEGQGISTVIVEETGDGATDWLTFVVDVVFEVDFEENGETRALERKLWCTKSRYATAIPGPHDYGLDEGRLELWPDILAVVSTSPSEWTVPRGRQSSLKLTRHLSEFLVGGGDLVIASAEYSWLPRRQGPADSLCIVVCGIVTEIQRQKKDPDASTMAFVLGGPSVVGWMIVDAVRERDSLVVFRELEKVLRREPNEIPFLRVVEALRMIGVLVIVEGPKEILQGYFSRVSAVI